MTSRQTEASEAALVPLLLGKQRCNITFIVESSEDMRAALASVKRLLIQTLLAKASFRDSLFNIVTYSGELTCWSHHMLPCAPDTVYLSLSWIHSITCRPGRDLLAALSVAFTDPSCHAVHLLCTELPDQPEAVLRALPALAAGRPANIFYLQDSGAQLDRNTQDYLQGLTQTTRGSCYVIPVGLDGEMKKAIPLCVVENYSSVPTDSPVKCFCPASSVITPQITPSALLRCSLGNSLHLSTSCVPSCESLSSPEFFPGCRVLARKEVDGFYYLGTVIQQGRGGVWLVDFDHPGWDGLGVVPSQRQLVCSLDMVKQTRALTRYLVPGDAVLSPWEPDLRRYGPGRVMSASERRDGCGVGGVSGLRVLMWHGSVSLVPRSVVSPISASQHDRIVRELQILQTPASCRCCGCFCARSSSCTPRLLCSSCCPSASCCGESRFQHRCRSSFGRTDGFERAEQDRKEDHSEIDARNDELDLPSTASSLSQSEDESRKVTLRSKEQRPPWRYWRRTGAEPQHRQPGGPAVPKRTSQPVSFSFPVPQISASPNHSSLFQSLPGRRANVRDVFGTTSFKPRPPAGRRPFSANNARAVYT